MTATAHSEGIVFLLEYWYAYGAGSVREQLEYWELDGPRYCLNVQQFASPDGAGYDAWISVEVADQRALWLSLEDWARARRVDAQAVADARRALSQIISAPSASTALQANAIDNARTLARSRLPATE